MRFKEFMIESTIEFSNQSIKKNIDGNILNKILKDIKKYKYSDIRIENIKQLKKDAEFYIVIEFYAKNKSGMDGYTSWSYSGKDGKFKGSSAIASDVETLKDIKSYSEEMIQKKLKQGFGEA